MELNIMDLQLILFALRGYGASERLIRKVDGIIQKEILKYNEEKEIVECLTNWN